VLVLQVTKFNVGVREVLYMRLAANRCSLATKSRLALEVFVHVHISKVYGYQSQVYAQLFLHFSKDLSINSTHAQIQNDCHMRNGFGTYFTDHTFWLVGAWSWSSSEPVLSVLWRS